MNFEHKKIACLLITHLGIKEEILRHPELVDRELILYTQGDSRSSRISSIRPVVFDVSKNVNGVPIGMPLTCLLYTSPSPRDRQKSRMPSCA